MKRCLVLLLFFTSASVAFGQSVYVNQSGDDLVGQRFAYALKEQLRKSTSYIVVDSVSDKAIIIGLVTTDANSSFPPGTRW